MYVKFKIQCHVTTDLSTFEYLNVYLTTHLKQNQQLSLPKYNRQAVLSKIPTEGTWQFGDKAEYTNPLSAGYIGAVCVTAGTPGTWRNYGALV